MGLSNSKTAMKGPKSDQNGDFKKPPIFPGEENWLGFRGRLSFPCGQGTMPASRLQTVFSITHSAYSIMRMELSHHCFIKDYQMGVRGCLHAELC